MSVYFLDTSIIIPCLRGERDAYTKLQELEGELVSGYICLAELYEGIFRVKDRGKAEQAVGKFFDGLSTIYTIDRATAQAFGSIRAGLKEKGRVIGDIDILIAATCLAHRLLLVTANPKHFNRVKGLEVVALL